MLGRLQSMLRSPTEEVTFGIWSDEHQLVQAVKALNEKGYKKFDAILPFPVHGLDEAIGRDYSNIPWTTFFMGLMGALLGLLLTWWTSAVDYAVVIGGKPFFSLPAFIPIIFETTILFAALSSVGALFVICGLPAVDPPILHPDLTSHKFAIYVPRSEAGYEHQKIETLLKELGAEEVGTSEF